MKIIQYILLFLGLIPILIIQFGFKISIRAGYRVGFISFVILFFTFAFFPNLVQFIAEIVEVGRGSDLILYMTTFCFICFVLIVIIKFEKLNQEITTLTRNLAVHNSANSKYKKYRKSKTSLQVESLHYYQYTFLTLLLKVI